MINEVKLSLAAPISLRFSNSSNSSSTRNFSAGGIATPADAALMMYLGAEGVFVGSGIFLSEDPPARARAIVEATTHWDDPAVVARVSRGLREAMPGIEIAELGEAGLLQTRGW